METQKTWKIQKRGQKHKGYSEKFNIGVNWVPLGEKTESGLKTVFEEAMTKRLF